MVTTLSTVIPLGSKSGARHPSIHTGVDELDHNNDSRDRGGYNHHDLRGRNEQMEWGQYNQNI